MIRTRRRWFTIDAAIDRSILNYMTRMVNIYGGGYGPMQSKTGSVMPVINPALALGRNVALLMYADYVAGANWAKSSEQIARHTAGSVETIQQNDIIAPGKTWEYMVVMSNRTAGSVAITGGDAPVSSNGSITVTITATGRDVIVTPSNDFDGDIDLAQGTVKQTNIAASTAFPGSEELTNGDFTVWDGGANPNNFPTGWILAGNDATNYFDEDPAGKLRLISDGTLVSIKQTSLTSGKRYRATLVIDTVTSGGVQVSLGTIGSVADTYTTVGTHVWEKVADGTEVFLKRGFGLTTDVVIPSLSIAEVNPLNGDIIGATIGQPANNQLKLAWLLDAVNDYGDISSAELNSILNPAKGMLAVFIKSNTFAAGVDYFVNLQVDANNGISISRSAANILLTYIAGGTTKTVTIASGSLAGFFLPILTWDTNADKVNGYLNNVAGTPATGLGTWVGNLDSAKSVIGAASTVPANVLDGYECHWMLLRDIPPLHEREALAKLGGVL